MTREPTALRPMFGDPIGEWHQWFAWRPVFTYDRRLVWLRIFTAVTSGVSGVLLKVWNRVWSVLIPG